MAVRKKKGASGVQLGEDVARNMIVAGGARVFAQRGIRDTSVEDLLEASKVSRRTFYRLFTSKDDVALALYKFGTTQLVENWKRALASSTDPLEQFSACIDVHLRNAAMLGRLIFVLGGEATRQESPLHEHRMKTHDKLIELLCVASPQMAKVDPLLIRGMLFALEAVTRHVLAEGDEGRRVSMGAVDRARRVMVRLATASFAGTGKGVAEIPLADE